MSAENKEKVGFFDIKRNLGFKLSPFWVTAIGLILIAIFNGGLLGSIGVLIFILGIINLIMDFFRKKRSSN